MTDVIAKPIVTIDTPELNLANRESEPVTNVIRGFRACLRTPAHCDAHEANRKWFFAEPNRFVTTRSAVHRTVWKRAPRIFPIGVQMHRIFSTPVLHSVLLGEWRAPMNPNGIDGFSRL